MEQKRTHFITMSHVLIYHRYLYILYKNNRPAVIDFLEINQNYISSERNGGNSNNMATTPPNQKMPELNTQNDLSSSQTLTESDLDVGTIIFIVLINRFLKISHIFLRI